MSKSANQSASTTPSAVLATEPVAADSNHDGGFRALGLSDALVTAVENSGYTAPTPIQAQAIPLVLEGRDVLGMAQTGTGKTAAFALPLLDRIDLNQKTPQVLVLTPTRELAIQAGEFFQKYSKSMQKLRVVPIYGGQDYLVQQRLLSKGVHVVVGTPGRVMDQMRRGVLKMDGLKALVLDEADEMLRMGFADDVEWVLTQIPEQRQIALFSATMPGPIRRIAQKHLNDPAEITIKQRTATADTVNQRYIVAGMEHKRPALARILEAEDTDGVLVFVKTKNATEPLADYLSQAGLKTAALNGDVAQKQRERIVESLRAGRVDIIVATDVAARGLDVQRISHVINFDLPYDSEAYIHRIGRTGRAGRSGEAILFVHPREQRLLKRIEHATRQRIQPMELPSNRDINKKRVAKFHTRITEALDRKELDTYQSLVDHYLKDNEVPIERVAAALALLSNQETQLLVRDDLKMPGFARESRYEQNGRFGRPQRPGQADHRGGSSRPAPGMESYRIEVGRNHNVQPGNIVGAIANEAGISSQKIGKIMIFDRFSTVDLPANVPPNVMRVLSNVFVAGQKLRISRKDGPQPRLGDRPYAKRAHGKPAHGKPPYAKPAHGKRPFPSAKGKAKHRKGAPAAP